MLQYMYFIFLVIGCNMSVAMQPKYLWPFSGLTNDLEVMANVNQNYSTLNLSECFPIGPGHPDLGYTSLYFGDTQFVDVRIPYTETDLAVTIFFKTEADSGVLFYYKSDDQTVDNTNSIRIMDIKIIPGYVAARGVFKDHHAQPSFKLSFNSNTWTTVALVSNFINNSLTVTLYVDNRTITLDYGRNTFLMTPGTLRFGESQSTVSTNKYRGFMTGAALYYSYSSFDVHNLLQNALKGNWSWTPPVPPCTVPTSHVWALDNKGLTMDLKTSKRTERTCLRFGDKHPDLPNNATLIDGSSLSTLSLEINGAEVDSDFALVINIYVQNQTSGSLIKITDEGILVLFDLVISETEIVLNAFFSNGIKCGSISIENMLDTNTWHLIGITRDISAGTMAVLINNDIINSTADTCGMFRPNGGLLVQIGSSNLDTPGYRGLVRCLVMFNSLVSNITLANHDTCIEKDDNVPSDLFNTCKNCPASITYDLFQSNKTLSSSLEPLAVYSPGTGRLECAVYCYQHQFCRSFAYSDSQCSVYDLVTELGLIFTPGAKYYVVNTGN